MLKSIKSNCFINCISSCSKTSQCNIAIYKRSTNRCNQFNGLINDQYDLIDSNNAIVYYYDEKSSTQNNVFEYTSKPIPSRIIQAGSDVYSLVQMKNGDLVCGCLNHKIIVWNTIDWSFKSNITGHQGAVNSLAVLQNGYLVSGSSDRTIKIWNHTNQSLIRTLNGHTGNVRRVIILRNGDIVSGSEDKKAIIWDSNTGAIKHILNHTGTVRALSQLNDGPLITADNFGTITIINPISYAVIKQTTDLSLAYNAALWLKNEELALVKSDQYIIITNMSFAYKKYIPKLGGQINDIMQLPNQDIVSILNESYVLVWDWNSKTLKYNLTGHSRNIMALTLLDDKYLVTGGTDEAIIIWK